MPRGLGLVWAKRARSLAKRARGFGEVMPSRLGGKKSLGATIGISGGSEGKTFGSHTTHNASGSAFSGEDIRVIERVPLPESVSVLSFSLSIMSESVIVPPNLS